MRRFFALVLIAALVAGVTQAAEPAKTSSKFGAEITGATLGAEIADVTPEDAARVKLAKPAGVRIVKLKPGSPAEAAGLQAGDVVLMVDGKEQNGTKAFNDAIAAKDLGARVRFMVMRDGATRSLKATLAVAAAPAAAAAAGTRSIEQAAPARTAAPAEPVKQQGMLGLEITDVTKQDAEKLRSDEPVGVKVVKPTSGSPAETAGLQPGDIVLSVDGVEFNGQKAFVAAISAKGPGAQVKLKVLREGGMRTLTATLAARPAAAAAARPVEQAAAGAPESPLKFMLDTGGHTALIRQVIFTQDGKSILSTGDDKVIRVWDLASGRTARIIRGSLGPADEGKIYALALSPDGKTLAAAGWTNAECTGRCGDIRIYDVASGNLTGLLKGHASPVDSLAFSPAPEDQPGKGGRLMLISGSKDKSAIIWDFESRTALRRLEGHTDQVQAVGFTPDGLRAVTASFDQTLRLWQVSDGSYIEMKGHLDKVHAISVRPRNARDGAQGLTGLIASGDYSGEIRLWDGKTGGPFGGTRERPGVLANQATRVGALAFSPDGTKLVSTVDKARVSDIPFGARVFDVATGRELVNYTGHDNTVLAASVSADGLVATGGGNNQNINVWELITGKPVPGGDGKPLIMGGTGQPRWSAGFSADGSMIAWGSTVTGPDTKVGYGPLEFRLRLPRTEKDRLGEPEPITKSNTAWRRAEAEKSGYSLTQRKSGSFDFDTMLDLAKDGKVIKSIERFGYDGFQHRAFTFTTDALGQISGIISGGGNGFLIAYDLAGNKLGNFVGHDSDIWAVATSADGRLLVSSGHDQTVRLWNLKTRELIITLFRGTDGQWIAWTPQGYYTGSPGADRLIGWQLNKGPDQTPDYISADQLSGQFDRPDIVAKAIVGASAIEAVSNSEGTKFKLEDLTGHPTPKLKITSPAADAKLSGGETDLKIQIERTPDPVDKLTVHVNGITLREQTIGDAESDITLKGVSLAEGANIITVIAHNKTGNKTLDLHVTHKGKGELDEQGVLFVVAIGVDKFEKTLERCGEDHKTNCDLDYAGADAKTFAATIQKALGPRHGRVEPQLLTASSGTPPNAENIRNALRKVRNRATQRDTVVVFFAGHGFNDGADYIFLPSDVAYDAENSGWSGAALYWSDLGTSIFGTLGTKYVFVDTCHSSGAFNATLGSAAFKNDVTAFTATGPNGRAPEIKDLEHGLFTYAIWQGLGDDAKKAAGDDKVVRPSTLATYLKTLTAALIKKYKPGLVDDETRPIPQMFRARDAKDHVLVRVE